MSKKKCGCDEITVASPLTTSSCCVTGSRGVSGEPCVENESDPCCTSIIQKMDFFIKNLVSFNMPGCGMVGTILLESALRLYAGAILFAEDVGYLRVTLVKDDCSVEVLNECVDCSEQVAEAGEPIPAGTQFGVGIPSCIPSIYGGSSNSGVFLDIDFLVPEDGECTNVKVTSIEGLGDNFQISIANRLFRINSIIDSTTIEICNDGGAGAAGELVEKDPNGDGELDVPIIITQETNPCEADLIQVGKLLACSSNQAIQPMVGSIDNQVPAWVEDNSRFELKVFENLSTCVTVSSCCLTLDPEEDPDHEYTIHVTPDTASLAIQLVNVAPNFLRITIDGDEFYLTEVIDNDSIKVIPRFTVDESKEYPAGVTLCVEGCCEQIYESFIHGGPFFLGRSEDGDATYTLPAIGAITDYYDGLLIRWQAHASSSNAGATIKIGNLGVRDLTVGAGGTPLKKYDVMNNQIMMAQYNAGSSSFVLLTREIAFNGGPNEGGTFDWSSQISAGMTLGGGGSISDINVQVADFVRIPFSPLIQVQLELLFRVLVAGDVEIKIPLPSTLPGISIGTAIFPCYVENNGVTLHGGWRNDTTHFKFYRILDNAGISNWASSASANNRIGLQATYRYY